MRFFTAAAPAAVLGVFLLGSCVQAPSAAKAGEPLVSPEPAEIVSWNYRLTVSSRAAGFSILLNGTEIAFFEGAGSGVGGSFSASIPLNDWMISGENEFSISIFWPENVRYVPGMGNCAFSLTEEKKSTGGLFYSILYSLEWPLTGQGPSAFNVTKTFVPKAFPAVRTERAEPVISSTGVLPMADQRAITAVAGKLREAFAERNLAAVNSLMSVKYADLAAARFLPEEDCAEEMNAVYAKLMGRDGFAVKPLNGHYSFLSTANDRLVKVMQGRVGFPEAAIILTYQENGRIVSSDLDLYFAKIDGTWVIIR